MAKLGNDHTERSGLGTGGWGGGRSFRPMDGNGVSGGLQPPRGVRRET